MTPELDHAKGGFGHDEWSGRSSADPRLLGLLDALYPDACSELIVEHDGKHYQARYTANRLSRSGRVKGGWTRTWVELSAEQVDAEGAEGQRRRS